MDRPARQEPMAEKLPATGDREAIKTIARAQFEKWALSYDRSWLNEIVFFPSIRRCQEEIARWKLARGGQPYRVLDVGCGTGTLLSLLARDPLCDRAIGLDYAKEMVRRAASKFAQAERPERLQALNGDAERLPLCDAGVDIVTCCNSFHHYPHQGVALREFRRVLRPGGRLILIDGFRDNVIGWLVFDVGVEGIEKCVHHASWSEVRTGLQQAGFTDINQSKMGVLAPLLVSVAAA
ncbi:MAG: class I SAM-dependent methyltransferase [Phycisphaerales bacterium]|nr:class I SAM-dependent methyltransferase [Phycisphaerales bacterium]